MNAVPAGLAAALALTAAGRAAAQVADEQVQQRYTPAYVACMASREGQSTRGMIDCISAEDLKNLGDKSFQ